MRRYCHVAAMVWTVLLLSAVAMCQGHMDNDEASETYYNSVCDNDTEWNRKRVGAEIKRWISSIRVDAEMMPTDKAISFYDLNNTLLEFIGNVDPQGYALGRFWVSGGRGDTESAFNNGFYYGLLDTNGKLSGKRRLLAR